MAKNTDSPEKARPDVVKRRPPRARVLIAEDEWAFREMLVWAFENAGYEAVAVNSGTALLDALASTLLPNSGMAPFDLVISDLRMPGWTGIAALENLSRSPLVPPVVVITAFGSEEVHRRAQQAGAVAVLDKPFDIEELTALGRRVLARSVS